MIRKIEGETVCLDGRDTWLRYARIYNRKICEISTDKDVIMRIIEERGGSLRFVEIKEMAP
jgi:hypothetical protein